MPKWNPIQNSFSGGEVSARLIMRTDAEIYAQSLLLMRNFMPTLQGTAVRVPGSRFIFEVESIDDPQSEARIIHFFDSNNVHALAVFTDASVEVHPDINTIGGDGGLYTSQQAATYQASFFRIQVLFNTDFSLGRWYWHAPGTINPPFLNNAPLPYLTIPTGFQGVDFITVDGTAQCVMNTFSGDVFTNPGFNQMLIRQFVTITVPTDFVTLRIKGRFLWNRTGANFNSTGYAFFASVLSGNDLVGNIVIRNAYDLRNVEVAVDQVLNMATPPGFTGVLTVQLSGFVVDSSVNNIELLHRARWDLVTLVSATDAPTGPIPPLASPYLRSELKDVQFVQSPFDDKELVLVHPNHEPHVLYWDTIGGAYVMEPVTWTGTVPAIWSAGNYPASCSAYQGRLILGGAGFSSENIWGSEVGDWHHITDVGAAEQVDPFDIRTTFRSPIRWIQGQKNVLVGTESLEYVLTSDSGILNAADVHADAHTSHGGANVQPAVVGDQILYAAERGTTVRAMQDRRDNVGYIAPDLTLLCPHLTAVGIRRMVTIRNPHKIVICVLDDGSLAILNYDSDAEIKGWSRITTDGEYLDITVSVGNKGQDIPFLLVRRTIEEEKTIYLESISDWFHDTEWRYVDSYLSFSFDEPTSVITGLDHLEGVTVQAIGDGSFIGDFRVENGEITLMQAETPLPVLLCDVGIAKPCRMDTLPPVVGVTEGGAGAKKRYSEIGVRLRKSTLPIINGERPSDRSPLTAMNTSESLIELSDTQINNLGWDEFQFITIEENAPFRVEIVGIFGKLASKTL